MKRPVISHKNRGFSIVELVVVVLVIGILSSIIGAVYYGAQNNAKTTQYKTDVDGIAKKAEIAAGDNDGLFPLTASDFAGSAKLDSDKNITIGTILSSSQAAPSSLTSLSTPPAYTMHVCNTNRTGVRIYYPNLDKNIVDYVDSGDWQTNC